MISCCNLISIQFKVVLFFKGVIIQSNLSLHVTSLYLAQKKKYLIFCSSYVPNKTASAEGKIIDWRHLVLKV